MANTLRLEIIVDDKGTPVVQKFADGTTAALGKVEAAGSGMGGGFEKSWAGIATGANQAIQLFQQVASAVQAPIEAYMASEQALMKMGMAMKNQGDFSRAGLADMEAFAAQIQKVTAYEDDATLAVMGNLKSFGMTNEEVKRATQTALDFATAKANEGMTVERASEILGKAYLGQTTGLKKLGIQVDENAKGSEVFDSVMGQLQQRFGGSAAAELETYAGQWKQLKNQWGDIQEFLGLVFLKTIEGLLTTAGLLATTFMTAGESILRVIEIITLPFTFLLNQFAKLAELAGLTGTADALRAIASATGQAKDSITSAKEGVLKWTSAQYDAMMATDKVTGAIGKMGIAGQRTQAIDEEAAKKRKAAMEQITEAIRKASYEAETIGQTQYQKDIARINSEAAKYKALGVDKVTIARYVAVEMEKADKKAYEEMAKAARSASDEAIQAMMDEIAMGEKKTAASMASLLIMDKADQRFRATLYDRMKQQATDEERLIRGVYVVTAEEQDKIAEYHRLTGVKITEDQVGYIDLMLKEYRDTFGGGVKQAFIDMEDSAMTFGEASYGFVKTFADASKSALSDTLFQAFKTGTVDAGKIWETFSDTMLKKFTDTLSQMVIDAAMKEIKLAFGAVWTDAAKSVLGTIARIAGSTLENWLSGGGGGASNVDSLDSIDLGGGIEGRAYGGRIPGYASGGDSPANDTVPAWLSPGEVVIRRTAVNPDTEAILDYINRYGRPPQYAFGGRVMNTVTDTPGRGYWGFSDILSAATGGLSEIFTGPSTQTQITMPDWEAIAGTLLVGPPAYDIYGAATADGGIYGMIDRLLDPGGEIDPKLRALGTSLPEQVSKYAPMVGDIIGSLWGPWMAAAGAGAGAKIAGYDTKEAMETASLAALMTYISSGSNGVDISAPGALQAVAENAAKNFVKKWAIGQMVGALFPAENAGLNVNFEGMEGGPDLSGLGGLTQIDPFAFKVMGAGGPFPAGRPFWAGEKGAELVFPSGGGHVLDHGSSMAYAAFNGGYIPGFAAGTVDPNLFSTYSDYRRAVLDSDLIGSTGGGYSGGSSASNADIVKTMKKLIDDMQKVTKASEKNAGKMLKILDKWDNDGLPAERTI